MFGKTRRDLNYLLLERIPELSNRINFYREDVSAQETKLLNLCSKVDELQLRLDVPEEIRMICLGAPMDCRSLEDNEIRLLHKLVEQGKIKIL